MDDITKSMAPTATKLMGIAKRSGEDLGAEFKWLMPHFTKEALVSCFNELNPRKAVGADGKTKEMYGANLLINIEDLIEKMKKMAYRPSPVREVLIPKDDKSGARRPLGISIFEDKIVQLMTAKVLEAIYEPVFLDCSYGFRPNRSCHMAIEALHRHLFENRCEVIIDVDLKNFFGTLDHDVLLDILRTKIKDERFIRYIARMLKAGVLSDGELRMTDEGSPQGNIASPVLANIYAHTVIDSWFEEVVKKHASGSVEMFRYADDLVICCQFKSDSERINRALKGRLEKYGLKLNEEKTKLVSFDKEKQAAGTKQESFDFLGFTFYLGRTRKGRMVCKLKTSKTRLSSKLRKVDMWIKANRNRAKLKALWSLFTRKLTGHIRY